MHDRATPESLAASAWRTLSAVAPALPREQTLKQEIAEAIAAQERGYYLPDEGSVNITIYNMMGREIKVLQSGIQRPGHGKVQWNATNNIGQPVSAGVYIYQINVDGKMDTKKMVLLK